MHRSDENYNSVYGHVGKELEQFLEDTKDEPVSLYLWGVGDHGGGPSRVDLTDVTKLIKERAEKAKEEGKLAIQVDANKDDQQPGYILTSVIKNTEVPVYEIVKEAVAGKIAEMDRVQSYSLASGAASITDLSEISKHVQESGKAKWEEIKTELADIEKKIGDGSIQVTNAQSGEKFDPAKCPNVTIK